ncbi:MAG TPA: hypothetical protein VMA72_02860 [Streptosporangiaceae bacterium]|nr:hypothetical protein [Streptosporangiaceae bacterium]
MSPAEQLLRDYLSRLSAAARGQLSSDERRALVSRTRDFIERKTSLGRPPTLVEVAKLLAGLGDPAGLVSQERQRLATMRGEELKPASRGRFARILRGDPDRALSASWHWPVQEGNRADYQLTLLDAGAPAAANGSSSNGAGSARKPGGAATREANGHRKVAGPRARDVDGLAALVGPRSGDVTPTADVTDISAARPAQPVPIETGSVTWQPAAPGKSRRTRAAAALGRLAGWARRNKVEAVAVVLLGIGGSIFPPVWLLGAAVALASRLWDLRDKWLALAVPVLLTVIGLAVGVSAAGSSGTLGHHLHEGWLFADVISRLTALLGASYLAWRSAHGRRPPATPPWSKPHKVG